MAKLNLNTVDGLTKLMNEMNNVFNKKIKKVELDESIKNIDNISFIECRQLFEGISDKLYDSKSGSKLIVKYIKTIKENNELKRMYVCSDVLKYDNASSNPTLLVKEAAELMSGVDKKKLDEGLKELKSILKEAVKDVKVTTETITSAISESKDINNDITYILTEEKKPSNLVAYTNAMNNVIGYITESNKKLNENCDKVDNIKIKDIEKLLENDLEIWENAAIEKLVISDLAGNSKQNIFEEYKSNCMNLINDLLEDDDNETITKSQLMNMKEGLEKKTYHEETANDDIMKLAQLESTLKD